MRGQQDKESAQRFHRASTCRLDPHSRIGIAMWLMSIRLANIDVHRSGIAQLEERGPVKAMVGGSSPPAGAEILGRIPIWRRV